MADSLIVEYDITTEYIIETDVANDEKMVRSLTSFFAVSMVGYPYLNYILMARQQNSASNYTEVPPSPTELDSSNLKCGFSFIQNDLKVVPNNFAI